MLVRLTSLIQRRLDERWHVEDNAMHFIRVMLKTTQFANRKRLKVAVDGWLKKKYEKTGIRCLKANV
jgi:GTP cyclohydrolase FolE2